MSDTASCVATVLRDKTVDDLKEENDKLTEIIQAQLILQITGTNRLPIYLEESLTSIKLVKGTNGRKLYLEVYLEEACQINVDALWNLEIWVGGILVEEINVDVNNRFGFVCRTHEVGAATGVSPKSFLIGRISCNRAIESIGVFLGTISSVDYEDRKEEMNRITSLIRLKGMSQRTCIPQCMIGDIYFRANKISGILSLLKSVGISLDN